MAVPIDHSGNAAESLSRRLTACLPNDQSGDGRSTVRLPGVIFKTKHNDKIGGVDHRSPSLDLTDRSEVDIAGISLVRAEVSRSM
jgi:hypothetical protein